MGWVDLAGGLKPPCTPPMAPGGAENGSTSLETMGTMGSMDPMDAAGPALGPVGGCRAWDRPGPWAQAHGPGTWQPPTGSRAGPMGPMGSMGSHGSHGFQ